MCGITGNGWKARVSSVEISLEIESEAPNSSGNLLGESTVVRPVQPSFVLGCRDCNQCNASFTCYLGVLYGSDGARFG